MKIICMKNEDNQSAWPWGTLCELWLVFLTLVRVLKPDGQAGPAHVAVAGLSVSMCAASH